MGKDYYYLHQTFEKKSLEYEAKYIQSHSYQVAELGFKLYPTDFRVLSCLHCT